MHGLKFPLIGMYVLLYLLLVQTSVIHVGQLLPSSVTAAPAKIFQPILLFFAYVGVPLLVGFSLKHLGEIDRKDKCLILLVSLIAFDIVSKTWVALFTSPAGNKVLVTLGQNGMATPQLVVGVLLIVVFLGWMAS